MSVAPPVCQLLQRQPTNRYDEWLHVALPRDAAQALEGVCSCWVTDITIAETLSTRHQNVHLGIEPPEALPHGALLYWPKSHALGIWWLETLCHWLPEGTPIEIVGEHHGGIKRVPKVLAAAELPCSRVDNARRCSLFATTASPHVPLTLGWGEYQVGNIRLASHPGVFANGRLDAGTEILLDQLAPVFDKKEPNTALDAGCGDGIISVWLALRGIDVSALDADAFAVEATRRSLALNGVSGDVEIHDMLSGIDRKFDVIVSNPPFHQAQDIDYGPARRLIRDAVRCLMPKGQLFIVANSFLPYRAPLEEVFRQVDVLVDNGRYRVYQASQPKPVR